MVSKVADGGPASKEDGLKVQDRILKVGQEHKSSISPASFQRKPSSARVLKCTRSLSPIA